MTGDFELIVRNGTLVSGAGRRAADVGVREGRIAALEPPGTLAGRGTRELDASGLFVLPGLIDGHVHFRQPGLVHKEDWRSGSTAAVMGGVTTVLEMPNTLPPTTDVVQAEAKIAVAEAASLCDFGIIGLLGEGGREALEALIGSGLIAGLKVFLGPTTGALRAPSEDELLAGLELARGAGLRVSFHAEDAALIERAEAQVRAAGRNDPLAHLAARPVEAEVTAIEHAARLLGESGAAGHILHLSSVDGLAAVEEWRGRGLDLTCELTAHHCLLSSEDYPRLGGLVKCNPPVREASHGRQLLRALAGGRIDCLASDHAPHAPAEKQASDIWQVAPGIAGVETTLPLLLTNAVHAGELTLEQLVRAFSERPAQAWRLWPRKGALEPGSDADLTLVDLRREGVIRGEALHGKHGLTPFEGWPTRGAPVATIVRGRIVMEQGRLTGEPGWGRRVSPGDQ
jgi:dihydroorotase